MTYQQVKDIIQAALTLRTSGTKVQVENHESAEIAILDYVEQNIGASNIVIPQLYLVYKRYHFVNTTTYDRTNMHKIDCFWRGTNTQFLNHNPRIWLFRYKRLRKKSMFHGLDNETKKWSHEPHLLGVNSVNPGFYCGQISSYVSEISTSGRHTEWDLTATSMEVLQQIPIDPFEWIAGLTKDNIWVKLSENWDYVTNPISYIKVPGRLKHSRFSQPFRVALVIDNPDYDAENPLSNPVIIGPLSETFYMRPLVGDVFVYDPDAGYEIKYSYINRIQYMANQFGMVYNSKNF